MGHEFALKGGREFLKGNLLCCFLDRCGSGSAKTLLGVREKMRDKMPTLDSFSVFKPSHNTTQNVIQ